MPFVIQPHRIIVAVKSLEEPCFQRHSLQLLKFACPMICTPRISYSEDKTTHLIVQQQLLSLLLIRLVSEKNVLATLNVLEDVVLLDNTLFGD